MASYACISGNTCRLDASGLAPIRYHAIPSFTVSYWFDSSFVSITFFVCQRNQFLKLPVELFSFFDRGWRCERFSLFTLSFFITGFSFLCLYVVVTRTASFSLRYGLLFPSTFWTSKGFTNLKLKKNVLPFTKSQ